MIDFAIPEAAETRAKKLAEVLEPLAARRSQRDAACSFDAEAWRRLAEAGYLDALVHEADPAVRYVLRERVGLADPNLTLAADVSGSWAARLLELAGGQEGLRRRIATGEAIVGVAVTEPDAGSDRGAVSTRAEQRDGRWLLQGTKHWVALAGVATDYLVYARTDGGFVWLHVPADAAGVQVGEPVAYTAFRAVPLGEVRFTVELPDAALVAGPDRAERLREHVDGLADLTAGFVGLGMVERAFEVAREHAMARQQFGKAIAQYQEVHFRIAELRVVADGIRRTLQKATWAEVNREPDWRDLAAIVKLFAAREVPPAIDKAAEVLGAAAGLEGHELELSRRYAKAIAFLGIPPEVLGDRLAAEALAQYR